MSNKEVPKELLDILVCPKDKAVVVKTDDGNLKCTKCNTIYEVLDGIPIMLTDVDEHTQKEQAEKIDTKQNPDKKDSEEKQEEQIQKFKPHPLLTKNKSSEKKRISAKGEKSSKDPFLMIVEQHQEHKFRIAKVTALIFIIMITFFAIYFLYEHLKEKEQFNKRVENILSKVSDCRKTIAEAEGYDRAKAAFSAICYLERLKLIDWKNEYEWEEKKEFFKKVIAEEAKVQSGKNFICPTGPIDMVNIPQGIFKMGSHPSEKYSTEIELPQRNIIINYEFWASRTEITNMQFRLAYPYHRIENWAGEKLDDIFQPAAMLDWHMAMTFCRTVTDKESKAGRLPVDYEYRLPTEAEWEYLARAGTTTIFFWGNEFGTEGAKYANTLDLKTANKHNWKIEKGLAPHDGFSVSAPVGSFKPNAFGLYDTCGNVWEWCYDWFNPGAYKQLSVISPVQTTPVASDLEMRGPFDKVYYVEATSRVVRGGSWGNLPSKCRSAHRDSAIPETKNTGIGFRIVLAPKIEKLTASAENK